MGEKGKKGKLFCKKVSPRTPFQKTFMRMSGFGFSKNLSAGHSLYKCVDLKMGLVSLVNLNIKVFETGFQRYRKNGKGPRSLYRQIGFHPFQSTY